MFRKMVLAAALAVGMGGLATQGAEAAVVHPGAPANVTQAIQQGTTAAGSAQPVHYRPYYHRHRVCRVQRVRVRTHYGWRWVTRRVCR